MALEESSSNGNGFYMPVAPAYGGGGGFGGNNGFGGDWAWIILLLLLGWGYNGNGFGGGCFGGGNSDFPWLMTGQQNINTNTNNGFRDAMINDNITSVRDGIANLSTQLCGCCGDMQMAMANGFAGVEQGANARQIANMQSIFGVQSALQDCCCENRLANCQTQNIIQSEGSATRFADATNTQNIIQNQSQGIQTILDKLCQLELDNVKQQVDAKNDRIAELQNQLNIAALRESQTAQNAFIQQGFANEVDALYNRLQNCPVPTEPVYGRQPIFTCPQQMNTCGCGCGNGNF